MGGTIPAVQAPWTCLSQGSIETTLTDVVIVTLLTGRQASGKAVYQNTALPALFIFSNLWFVYNLQQSIENGKFALAKCDAFE